LRLDLRFEQIASRRRPRISMKMASLMRALTFGTAVALFAAPLNAGSGRDSSKVVTILALGDSLTDGFGLTRKEAYPALIGEKMRAANYPFEVTNAGVSGASTDGALARLPALLHR